MLTAKNINPRTKKYGFWAPIDKAVEAVPRPSDIRRSGPRQHNEAIKAAELPMPTVSLSVFFINNTIV